jgi:hypothetical protein
MTTSARRPVGTLPSTADSPYLDAETASAVAELFETHTQSAYTWDYRAADEVIQRLYRLGKRLNWDADEAIDWSIPLRRDQSPYVESSRNPYLGWSEFDALSEASRLEFSWHQYAWSFSQILHGEQGALLVASQLIGCAPTRDAKLFAASQAFDEARHVEVFSRYLRDRVGILYPVSDRLKSLMDDILSGGAWDRKLIGMQLIIESLALATFPVQRMVAADPLLPSLLSYVMRDEGRHVAFGVSYLAEVTKNLSEREREERASFALEACRVMRDRIVPVDVFKHFKLDVDEATRRFLSVGEADKFRHLLFTRIMPNLQRLGLITDKVAPLYDKLNLLQLAALPHGGDVDWASLEQPMGAFGAPAAAE